jgi:hypothetical protein
MECCFMLHGCGVPHIQLILLSFGIQRENSSQDTDVTVSWDKCEARSLFLLNFEVTFIMICCVSFCLKWDTGAQSLTGLSTACSWKLPYWDLNYAALFKIYLPWILLFLGCDDVEVVRPSPAFGGTYCLHLHGKEKSESRRNGADG